MKLKEQMLRKIKAQGKSFKTFETYWHYCEQYLQVLTRLLSDAYNANSTGLASRVKISWVNMRGSYVCTDP